MKKRKALKLIKQAMDILNDAPYSRDAAANHLRNTTTLDYINKVLDNDKSSLFDEFSMELQDMKAAYEKPQTA